MNEIFQSGRPGFKRVWGYWTVKNGLALTGEEVEAAFGGGAMVIYQASSVSNKEIKGFVRDGYEGQEVVRSDARFRNQGPAPADLLVSQNLHGTD
jgi:hypothetical protein